MVAEELAAPQASIVVPVLVNVYKLPVPGPVAGETNGLPKFSDEILGVFHVPSELNIPADCALGQIIVIERSPAHECSKFAKILCI